jgi:hypothetical protein
VLTGNFDHIEKAAPAIKALKQLLRRDHIK